MPATSELLRQTVHIAMGSLALLLRWLTWPQAVALVAYFGVAIAALLLAPRLGLVVAGGALVAHAAWDLVHYRRDAVVNRSLALWCLGLDVFLGGACVLLAIVG